MNEFDQYDDPIPYAPPAAPPRVDAVPPAMLGGGGSSWGPKVQDILAILGSFAGSMGGGPPSPLNTLALQRMSQRREAGELQKVGQAIVLSGGDPQKLAALQGQISSPRGQAMIDAAIEKASVLADKRAEFERQKALVDAPIAAGKQIPNPVNADAASYWSGDTEPVTVRRDLYQNELPPGAPKAGYTVSAFQKNPEFVAAEERAKFQATEGLKTQHEKNLIPVKAAQAEASKAAVLPLNVIEEQQKFLSTMGLKLDEYRQKGLISNELAEKLKMDLANNQQLRAAETQNENARISGTAESKADAAALSAKTVGPVAAANAGLAATATEEAKRKIGANDIAVPPAGTEYWDQKTRRQVDLTKEEARTGKAGVVTVAKAGADLNRLILTVYPQIVAAEKLFPRLLGQSTTEQAKRGFRNWTKEKANSDPAVSLLRQTLNALKIEEARTASGSTRVPVALLKLVDGSVPPTYSALLAAQTELAGLKAHFDNRISANLRLDMQDIPIPETGGYGPERGAGVKLGNGVTVKDW